MNKLRKQDLYSLEQYMEVRDKFRLEVMADKQKRIFNIGPNATIHFENRKIMQYQIQEMLRVEKIFSPDGIQEELDTYNPLIPDGSNWKATLMLEYENEDERASALKQLKGIDKKMWVRVGSQSKVFAIANEDLERENEEKTSSVHFLRFELTTDMVSGAKDGDVIQIGTDHEHYCYEVRLLPDVSQRSLVSDLN